MYNQYILIKKSEKKFLLHLAKVRCSKPKNKVGFLFVFVTCNVTLMSCWLLVSVESDSEMNTENPSPWAQLSLSHGLSALTHLSSVHPLPWVSIGSFPFYGLHKHSRVLNEYGGREGVTTG
jgi:hypothetical protein